MPKHYVFDFGWLIVEEDDGQVFALKDNPGFEGSRWRHGPSWPLRLHRGGKRWIADEVQAVQQLKGQERLQ